MCVTKHCSTITYEAHCTTITMTSKTNCYECWTTIVVFFNSPRVDLQFKGEGFQIFPNHAVSNQPIVNMLHYDLRCNMVIGMSTSNVIVLYSFTRQSIRNLPLHSVFSTHTILKYWLGTATFNCTALYKNHRKVEFTQNWNKENTVDLFANLKYTISKTYTGCEMSINHWQIFVLLYHHNPYRIFIKT